MNIFIFFLLLIPLTVNAMQPPPASAQDQGKNVAKKKQKKVTSPPESPIHTNNEIDTFWDDSEDTVNPFSSMKLERFKTANLPRSPRSVIPIAQSIKNNSDEWAYDSDEAHEIIKALESEITEHKDK